ncbi:MAG: integration host factor subunit beta [Phycisphaerales bacterium]|nr:MAG: integration host factor subunit beta [Phycisphaerales bacterium]
MATITKKELANRIVEETNTTHMLVKSVIQQFLDEITSELVKGNRLEFRDFGVFETKTRAAREAKNPRTNETVNVPPKRLVRFRAGRLLNRKLNSRKK